MYFRFFPMLTWKHMVTFTSTTLFNLKDLNPLPLTQASHKRGGTTPCCRLPKIHITNKSFTYDYTSIPDMPNSMMMTPLRIFFLGGGSWHIDGSTNFTTTGDKLRIRLTITVEHFAPKAHSLELDPEDAFSRCNDAMTVTLHCRTQTLIIRYKCHRFGWYRYTGSVKCSSILVKSTRILTGILQLYPIQVDYLGGTTVTVTVAPPSRFFAGRIFFRYISYGKNCRALSLFLNFFCEEWTDRRS